MTSRWGPLGWITLHSISANYPEIATLQDKLILRRFIDLFADTISCPSCKSHFGSMFQSYISRYPSWADGRTNLFLFVCRAHNTVNARLDKPIVRTVQESIDTLIMLTKVTSASEFRNQYLLYLKRNWARTDAEGFIMSGSVREMIRINNEYWNLRETNFNIHVPEADVLQHIISVKGGNGRPLPGFKPDGTPVQVGFSLRAGRFSLIHR